MPIIRLLALLVLLTATAVGQPLKLNYAASRMWYGGEPPAVRASGFATNRDLHVDTLNNKTYFHNGTTWVQDNITRRIWAGVPGPQGPQGAKGDKGDKGDTGATGPQGIPGVCPSCPPSGGGSGSGTFITPYLYNDFGRIVVAGYNSTATVSGAGVNPAVYAGVSISAADQFDWANLRYAIYLSETTRKPIYLYGQFKGINKNIPIGMFHYWLTIYGGSAELSSSSTAVTFMFDRADPTNTNNDWQAMISNTRWRIQDLYIKLQSGNTAFDTQMQNGSLFENIYVEGGKLGWKCNFMINTAFVDCKVAHVTEGGISIDNGAFPGATPAGSGSVANYIENFHFITFINCDYGIKLRYCESTVINKIIIEGYLVRRGIDWNGDGNGNFRELTINNLYCESGMSNGPYTGVGNGQAIVYVRGLSGKITINGAKSIYPAVLLDIGAQGGAFDVEVNSVSWWPNIGGKMFYTASDAATVRYQLYSWSWWYFPADVTTLFAGKAITYGCIADRSGQPTWSVCVR